MNNDFRRTLLGATFLFSAIMLWNQWLLHTGQQPLFNLGQQPAQTAPATNQQPTAGNTQAGNTAALPNATHTNANTASTTAATAQTPAPAVPVGEKVTVRTDVLGVTLNTTGASIESVDLLNYKQNPSKPDSPALKLMDMGIDLRYTAQTGLIGDNKYPNHLSPMQLDSSERNLADGKDELVVRFKTADTADVQLIKTYTFKRGSYAVDVQHTVVNNTKTAIQAQLYNQLVRDDSPGPDSQQFSSPYTGPAFFSDEAKYQKVAFDDIADNDADFQKNTSSGYAAMVQHYFVSAWVPKAGMARENFVRKQGDNLYAAGQIFNLGSIAPNSSVQHHNTLFVGPQLKQAMDAISPDLEAVKNYGWLTILAQPLAALLSTLYSWFGNWGWAIVGLVVILKIIFFWFNHKAYSSMAKMKSLAPKLEVAKERFKDDKVKLQHETMRIYREEKVNPLGGCLPMLIQMPVFFALYSTLSATVEMRGAPWILWIKDLSSADPLYILPILMAASSLLQVWLNPKPADPTQARMMWFMPLAFSVMFFFFPAGLVLYWLTNNILTIAQQWFITKRLAAKAA